MRTLIAFAIVLAYAILTVAMLRSHRRKAASATSPTGVPSTAAGDGAKTAQRAPWLVAFASQTGYAEQLARQTARSLEAANIPMRLRSFAELSVDEISNAERALFVVSTYGEGDPPDAGLAFLDSVMSRAPPLERLGYGLLALGDRTYRNFCGFGRTLDDWLRRQNAAPLFDLVEVDNADESALLHWQRHVGTLTGQRELPQWEPQQNQRWQIARRQLLNPGSAGLPCYHIELEPVDGAPLDWQAGDIAVLTPPGAWKREYSIASMPADGSLHILVRQSRRADGTPGVARWQSSGLLSRVDLAFSRNQHERIYVQHLIPPAAGELREWVAEGAAIYVCGSAEGMAAGVDEALVCVFGRARLNQLIAERRYRRDVY